MTHPVVSGLNGDLDCENGPTVVAMFRCESVAFAWCESPTSVLLEDDSGAREELSGPFDSGGGSFAGSDVLAGKRLARAYVTRDDGYVDVFENLGMDCGAVDNDGDWVDDQHDCDDNDPRVGALLYEHNFDEDDGSLTHGPKLRDPWLLQDGVARNLRGGQQALITEQNDWRNTVTFATVRADGVERKCRNCGYHAREYGDHDTAHAFWMPGFFDGDRSHQVRFFLREGSVFRINDESWTATLEAIAYVNHLGGGPGEMGQEWRVSMRWEYRGRGDDGVGTGGPKVELPQAQLAEIMSTWRYYDLVEGSMEQVDGPGYVELVQWPLESRYPLQVGLTANGKNTRFGAATWLRYYKDDGHGNVHSALGDININLDERDRYRAGILARVTRSGQQDEGYYGYRCAVARNSMVDCYEPGRFVQLAAFLNSEEDELNSECTTIEQRCVENTTFDQLARTNRTEVTNVLTGDPAELVFWAVDSTLVCEFTGTDGEHVVARSNHAEFEHGASGLSVLNSFSEFSSYRVCKAHAAP